MTHIIRNLSFFIPSYLHLLHPPPASPRPQKKKKNEEKILTSLVDRSVPHTITEANLFHIEQEISKMKLYWMEIQRKTGDAREVVELRFELNAK